MVARLRRAGVGFVDQRATAVHASPSAVARGVLSVRADGGSRARAASALQRLAGNRAVDEAIAGRATAVGFGECSTPDLQCTARADRANSKNLQVGAPAKKKDREGNISYKASGTVTSNFTTKVSIDLATVPDGLSDCAAKKVQSMITNKLKPHEEDHKRRFLTTDAKHSFVGPFTKTITESGDDPDSVQSSIHDQLDTALTEEVDKRTTRNDDYAINAIDPFHVTVDISDCPECSSDE